jgi:hypothetical protein
MAKQYQRPPRPSRAPNARKRSRSKPGHRHGDDKRKVDPVVTEIVRNGVIAVTEEMKTNLMRTAYNIIIYEALDFTTGCSRREARPSRSASGCRCSSAAWPRR